MPAQVHTPTPTLIPLSAPSLTVVQPAAPVRSPQIDISTQRTALLKLLKKMMSKAFERHIASFDETTIHALQPCHMILLILQVITVAAVFQTKAKSATEEIKPTLSKSTAKVIGASHANNWSHAPMEAATPTSRTPAQIRSN
ncbi:hypothetical protein BSLG_005794 [Batrachochytrium salamandrivorans]|nr:hypothetical protein BSLG_005794 [Batrachochytrium salamandrivorans]